MLEKILRFFERYVIPRSLYRLFQPAYHYSLALGGALLYRFPSRRLTVIAVTGTKGKSTTVELFAAMLEAAGHKTAILSTIHFKVGDKDERNLYKMTMPGRFFIHRFLRDAVRAGCTHAVIEMTSEGARFFRHKFVALDGLVVTNLTPEHIESHGSFEKYKEAKLAIVGALLSSPKHPRTLVVNTDMEHATDFLKEKVEHTLVYSLADAAPFEARGGGMEFVWRGEKFRTNLRGEFNLYNILGAATMAEAFGVSKEQLRAALESFHMVRGRVESVEEGQPFEVIVDYAHTTDSLEKLYRVFDGKRRICVLGGTGGGRDKWKRPEMGKIAERYCDEIILTDEDPYDENPRDIVFDIQKGISNKKVRILMDRRKAMAEAFSLAREGDVVLITGKGTDPFIMGPRGSKIPWDDAEVAREELSKLNARTA